jgi:hypothetical protein
MPETITLDHMFFIDDHLDLRDVRAIGCSFDGCILFAYGANPARLESCVFSDCLLTGDGWPEAIQTACNDALKKKRPRPEKGKVV